MKITLHLSADELNELKQALRERVFYFTRAQSPDLWERANVIDDILSKIYEQEGDD